MQTALWQNITAFNFDETLAEYSFATRLANENNWTIHFTEEAIIEYKKFMYLAATADFMVSPSAIIDTVWHQHLIFTQSYNAFCNMLGKRIEHIPATHTKQEYQKFQQAKINTNNYYKKAFGEQPAIFWNCNDIYEPLHLAKAKYKIRSLLLWGLLALIILIFPAYYLLKNLYVQIDNPYFLWLYFIIVVAAFMVLGGYVKQQLTTVVNSWNNETFIFKLLPHELVFLNKQQIVQTIHSCVNSMIEDGKINIEADHKLSAGSNRNITTPMELSVMEIINTNGSIAYRKLYVLAASKPAFSNISKSLKAFRKYFIKSAFFVRLFTLNFCVLALMLLFGLVRIFTGIFRDRPIVIILIFVIVFFMAMAYYLFKMTYKIAEKIIPNFYKSVIIPLYNNEEKWQ